MDSLDVATAVLGPIIALKLFPTNSFLADAAIGWSIGVVLNWVVRKRE